MVSWNQMCFVYDNWQFVFKPSSATYMSQKDWWLSHDSFLLPSDYASSSDSDAGMTVVDQAWRGDADSDAESIDSEQEDPLK